MSAEDEFVDEATRRRAQNMIRGVLRANPEAAWTRTELPCPHTHYVWDNDEACPLGWIAVCRDCGDGPLVGEDEMAGRCPPCAAKARILEIERLPATPELQEEWRALHSVAFGDPVVDGGHQDMHPFEGKIDA